MIGPRKIIIGIIASAFVGLTLLLAVAIIAPKVVDSEAVKAKVRSEIKEKSAVEIGFKHLALDFFPHPHIIFDQVTLAIPPGVKGKAVSVTVQPKILPLFLGKLHIAGLHFDSAELDYTLPEKPATGKTTPQPISHYNLAKRLHSVVSTLPSFKIPDLDFQINNSSANLFIGTRKFLELTEVYSHLEGPLAGRKITIRCKSNRWQRISVSGLLDARTFKGSQIDVSSTRQMVLAVAGKNDDVKDIFDIVKGGSVPLITLKSQGDSLSDLGDTDNMVIRGKMRDGEIYLPDIQFDLKNATGEVVISQGILEGHNLQARLGNSSGQNGSLKLGLIGDVAPFHLETDVRADLSQLAPILKRLVEKET